MKINILGCGSALPTANCFNSSQTVTIGEKVFMIDCGEGAQIRLREQKISTFRLNHIFISHLHGDHCFGLIGFISTLGMMERTADLHIHAHGDLEKILQPLIDYFCQGMLFKVIFHSINPRSNEVIYEDRSIQVSTIPLKHRIPTCGFLFEEKEKDRHLIREKIDFYQIPIKELHLIKKGADFVCSDGTVVPNKLLTRPADPSKKYAYCSDTAFSEKIIPVINGVDCLYHETTFENSDEKRAKETGHSTPAQAAEIAQKANAKQLIIGHYSARYRSHKKLLDEAKVIFQNTLAAEDGSVFEF